MPEKRSHTYLTPRGRIISWRWRRIPAILWLMLIGTVLSGLAALGRLVYLLARRGPIQSEDDFNLTVFLFLLCLIGAAVFSLVAYLLARPAEDDE